MGLSSNSKANTVSWMLTPLEHGLPERVGLSYSPCVKASQGGLQQEQISGEKEKLSKLVPVYNSSSLETEAGG